ncbi:MAG: UDP-N-acetylglucosamine 1-carboxyvinyltransferase [Lachnospiraceae bacterium]|nr:UDP-N-acetylglucosamine 1-carboxyvinyltransferase [Lachnospiraceae bacterium]
MSVIHIHGYHCLEGEIEIQGSKNAVLPVMAASLLHRGTTVITNVPNIQDVSCMLGILEHLGCRCAFRAGTVEIDASQASMMPISDTMARQMRSSIMLLGAMLGRFGEAVSSCPGGCSIGKRPIDLHLYGLRQLGASVRVEGERITASTVGLRGSRVTLAYPSVGATENVILAAVAARGITVLEGAAREPEIEILCQFLTELGARIDGIGSARLLIEGGKSLHDVTFCIPGDRIVAGTYLGAVMNAGGTLLLRGAPVRHMEENLRVAQQMGAELKQVPEGVLVHMAARPRPADFVTGPYPGFPTDLQSVMLAVASTADGVSHIEETVFENRFSTAKELQKLGAHIIIEKGVARVEGHFPLTGGCAEALDLRGGAALVVAGLAADGLTRVTGYTHIRRGYEDICRDLHRAGADIMLVREAEDERDITR